MLCCGNQQASVRVLRSHADQLLACPLISSTLSSPMIRLLRCLMCKRPLAEIDTVLYPKRALTRSGCLRSHLSTRLVFSRDPEWLQVCAETLPLAAGLQMAVR